MAARGPGLIPGPESVSPAPVPHAGLATSHRKSPKDTPDLGGLSRLVDFVFDKRQDQRGSAKKNRRDRHHERQFIRNTLAHLSQADRAESARRVLPRPMTDPLGKRLDLEHAATRHRDVPSVRPRDVASGRFRAPGPKEARWEMRATGDARYIHAAAR